MSAVDAQIEALAGRWHALPPADGTVFLLDIEGTTTPLPFVTKVLFPYASERLAEFVSGHLADVSPSPDDAALSDNHRIVRRCLREAEVAEGCAEPLGAEAFTELLRRRMDENSKVAYLKQLQGALWRAGYEDGALKGHLFADAARFIATEAQALSTPPAPTTSSTEEAATSPPPATVQIYSSGSIAAQQLLFRHSSAGDLTTFLTGYYDPSTVGLKTEAASYANIRRAVGPRHRIVFVTDSVAEVVAASASASIDLVLFCRRPLNNPLDEAQEALLSNLAITSIQSFDQIVAAVRPSSAPALPDLASDAAMDAALAQQVAVYSTTDQESLKAF